MDFTGLVASSMRNGLSQPKDFTAFMNQQVSAFQTAAENTGRNVVLGGMSRLNSGITNAIANPITKSISRVPGLSAALGSLGFNPRAFVQGGLESIFASLLGIGGGTNGGRPGTLTSMQARLDPLLSIDWTATIVDSGGTGCPIEDIYIEALQTASLRFDNKSVYRQGTTVNYAAGLSIDNANLVLHNDRSGKALKLASSWFNSVFDFRTRNFRMPIEYKKDVIVFLLDSKGFPVCRIDLVGCYPVSLNSTNLEATGSNLIPVTLDLSVDHCFFSGP